MIREGQEHKVPRLEDYVSGIKNKRDLEIVKCRLNGETLEEIGGRIGLTRERVRQISQKFLKEHPLPLDQDYKTIFENYQLSQRDFRRLFELPQYVYHYMQFIYKKGTRPFGDILGDVQISLDIKKRVTEILNESYIFIQDEKVKITTKGLLEYILKFHCQKGKTVDEIFDDYYSLLKEYELGRNPALKIHKRYLENKVFLNGNIMLGYGKRVRYYNMEEYDTKAFLSALHLEDYQDTEISTLKIFRDNQELMEDYQLMDEYELHHFLKKIIHNRKLKGVTIKKMPMIEVGKGDRVKQVYQLMEEMAPISPNELAKCYEEKYGVREATVKANMLKVLNEYYQNGVYHLQINTLEGYQLEKVKEFLSHEFYFLRDVKVIFEEALGEKDASVINNCNLKRLGYKGNADYIYSDRYASAEQYFGEVYLSKEMVDLDEIDERIIKLQAFHSVLKNYREDYELIEYAYHQYMKFSRLEELGVSKDLLRSFCQEVWEHMKDGEYFTLKYIKNKKIFDPLQRLEFGEIFYSSILRADIRFSFRRLGRTFLFRKSKESLSLKDFICDIMSQFERVPMNEFIVFIEEEYGIEISSFKMRELVKDTFVFYDKDKDSLIRN